jgi:hypothetical protein
MTTAAFLGARYTCHNGTTKKAAIRTISGFALSPVYFKFKKTS